MSEHQNLFAARQELRITRKRLKRMQRERVQLIKYGAGEARLEAIDARLAESKRAIDALEQWIADRESWVRSYGREPATGDRQLGLFEELRAEIDRRERGDGEGEEDTEAEEVAATLRAFREAAGI